MASGFVVRLQNLPWSASAPDVRDFFRGFEIPNGGVRIIGGDDGDCFISFVDARDAHDALRKDGSYLNDQTVRLCASSEEEMQYVIAIAKGENPPKPVSMYSRNEESSGRKRMSSPSRRDEPPHKQDNRSNDGYSANRERQAKDRPFEWHDSNKQTNRSRYDSNAPSKYNNGNPSSGPNQPKFYQEGSNQSHQQQGFSKQDRPPWSDTSIHPNSMATDNSAFPRINPNANFNSERQRENNSFSQNSYGGFQKQDAFPRGDDKPYRHEGQRDNETPLQGRSHFDRNFQPADPPTQKGSQMQGTRSSSFEDRFQSAASRSGSGNDRSDLSSLRNRHDDQHLNQRVLSPPDASSNQMTSFGPQYSNMQRSSSGELPPPVKNPHSRMNPANEFAGSETNSSRHRASNNENPSARFNSGSGRSTNQFHGSAQPSREATSSHDRFGSFKSRQFSDVDERQFPNSYNDRPRSRDFSENRSSKFDRDDRVDSDLRNARMGAQDRPAGPSKSSALLPTPDLPSGVTSLLDVNINGPLTNSRGPGTHSNRPPEFPLPPPRSASFREPPGSTDSHGPQLNSYSPQERMGNSFQRSNSLQNLPPQHGGSGNMSFPISDLQGFPSGMGMANPAQGMLAKPIVAITDPCAYFAGLPGDVTFKQMRGLFATHNIIAKDIKINWPQDRWKGISEAVVLFEGIDTTVKALNELSGMRISGKVFSIEPCPLLRYESFRSNELRRGEKPQTAMDSDNELFKDNRNDSKPGGRFENRLGGRIGDRLGNKVSSRGDGRRRDSSTRRSPERSRPRRASRSPPRRRSRSPRHPAFSERRRSPVYPDRDNQGPGRPLRFGIRTDGAASGEQVRPTNNRQSPAKRITTESASTKSSTPLARCAVLRGLPSQTTHKDVEQFLTDLQYDSSSLYMEFNVHGECTGTAYVELFTDHSIKMLMNSPRKLFDQTIQVTAVSKEQMAKSVDDHVKTLAADKTKPGEFILQLMGLPVDTTPKVVCEFLYPTKIVDSDVTIVKTPDSTRCVGTAFVKVHSLADRQEAIKHDRGYIGKRYVTIRIVTEQFMADFLSKISPKPEASEMKVPASQSSSRTIKMANVRYDIKPAEVETFFKDYNPEPGSVNFSMVNGMPNGRGTIRMATSADAEKAVKELNKLALRGRPLLLSVMRS